MQMPIRINEEMPVVQKLNEENIFIMTEKRAEHQDIRQLKIAVVNIMPQKMNTELQLLRLLSNSPLQTEVTFLRLGTHHYRNISEAYLRSYYKAFSDIQEKYFDGLIITGAPVETLPYEEVDYWKELTGIMKWSEEHVTSSMYICWAAQAGLYFHYGIPKYPLKEKLSGIYPHRKLCPDEELTRGFDDVFYAPHSRHTGVRSSDIKLHRELRILAESPVAGAYLILDKENKRVFVKGHPEYSTDTLSKEYFRDRKKNLDPKVPAGYFPEDDPARKPAAVWRCHSNMLFSNWLDYYVYQATPYNPFEDKVLYNL